MALDQIQVGFEGFVLYTKIKMNVDTAVLHFV